MKLYKDKSYKNNLGYRCKSSSCRARRQLLIDLLAFTPKIYIHDYLFAVYEYLAREYRKKTLNDRGDLK
jgi:hypothetical protein